MSEATSTFIDRFRAMPRALQWAAFAIVALLLFFVWDSYLSVWANDLNDQANRIQRRADDVLSGEAAAREARTIAELITSIGPVDVPRSATEGSAAVLNLVNQVIPRNGGSEWNFSLRPRGKLPKTALAGITHNKRVERITGDLKFEAVPKNAIAIIAELESHPDIESVISVTMREAANNKVKVHMVMEAWVLSSDSGGSI